MAFANSKSISLLLIVAISSLMMISAEEEVPSEAVTTGDRQAKQLFFVPQLTPASSYPVKYFSNRQYDLPLMMPKTSFIRGNPIRQQQQLEASSLPYPYPFLSSSEFKYDREEEEEEEEGIPAAWRIQDGINDFGHLKQWKRRFNRQAVITIHPAAAECTVANLPTEGLGSCKRASQANHGSIDIKLPVADQAAVIALTAHSPVNTRVRLICTDIVSAGVFTQTGKIETVADTPRTEVGHLQLVVTSTADNAVVKCVWHTYRHYTATFP